MLAIGVVTSQREITADTTRERDMGYSFRSVVFRPEWDVLSEEIALDLS